MVPIRIALPKGRLLRKTSALLERAGWGLDEYNSKISFYRPHSPLFPDLQIKVLHEKDIPIQVAIGNYDLGIASLDWVEELLVKYPSSEVLKVKDLGYGRSSVYLVGADTSIDRMKAGDKPVRIVSEYPNLAESFALKNHLARFSIFPVWGAAEAYPPEDAEMALVSLRSETDAAGMRLVGKVLDSSAFLIANRRNWESRNMANVIESICSQPGVEEKEVVVASKKVSFAALPAEENRNVVRIALPDGHQQVFTAALLDKAGILLNDYPSETGNRRPQVKLEGVVAKVIRPQDMPQQVACGSFDLAITGRDWLAEHLDQFPSSPVKQVLDLGFGRIRMVAVVAQSLPVNNVTELKECMRQRAAPLRVASEYTQIADRYARENHLGPYRVIPTWGATEAFLPDDADMLIENTETGRTIARHNLKIIDTLFESTGCVITWKGQTSKMKQDKIDYIVKRLRQATGGAA